MQKQVYFYNNEGEKLTGTLHIPEAPSEKGVVMGHCFTCSRHTRILTQISRELEQSGIMSLRFDFSGNGQSEGDFSESSYSKHISEMKRAIAFISENGASCIGVAGHSMGAAIAVLTASEMKNIRGVCALAGRLSGGHPAHFLNKLQKNELRQTGVASFISRGRSLQLSKRFFSDMRKYNIPERIRSLQSSLLLVHGDQDEIIPVEEARKAYNKNPSGIKLVIIPGADHMFSNDAHRHEIAELTANWFTEHTTK
ncbi:alpha/beta hydrolase [Desulfonema magnum]|uniref:Serine aminopeptidase, S33-type n=1 Tax=Desulfonema magnum TaxID=45655 RepID=A0A975GQE1_9BACT|nr:alpha/beta fold hydrolase [Desulfonema magnum]QTA89789.1 Serine aminopeptidase, S33-type [Desulfonema magnum]